jgi:hypothetical protein
LERKSGTAGGREMEGIVGIVEVIMDGCGYLRGMGWFYVVGPINFELLVATLEPRNYPRLINASIG